MTSIIAPGATLGILGSGQLGRMFAIAARRLGYGVQVYSPDRNTPAGQVCDREWVGAYDDLDQLRKFAAEVDVATLEFENISTEALHCLERDVPVRPGPKVLTISQNRLREKTELNKLGLPTARFAKVESAAQLAQSLAEFGGRGILKTTSWGYDGKGQRAVSSGDDLDAVLTGFAGAEVLLEGFVDFQHELSVIAVRGPQGDVRCYEPILNEHRNHILDVSEAPFSALSLELSLRAREMAHTVMTGFDVVGVLCVEMFLTSSGELLINEIAPRPHNSGHLTIDAHDCCQFEQQVRSICGLPLGSIALRQPAAMANLLGDLWQGETAPAWNRALQHAGLRLHLYGKAEARPGRKMGHLTCLAATAAEAATMARGARAELTRPAGG